MKLETVEIETKAGPVVINKIDFEKSKHKIYNAKSDKKKPADKKA